MNDLFEIPANWKLSPQQEVVIGSLIDEAGTYISVSAFCEALYEEDYVGPAPAKLRVLVQRCREVLGELTEGRAKIETKRNKGYRITRKTSVILRSLAA